MKIREILAALDARLLTPDADLEVDVHAACGSDMMSDVLAYVKDQGVLLTGLNNPQLAEARDIAVLTTDATMFSACGLLYEKGLRGGTSHV